MAEQARALEVANTTWTQISVGTKMACGAREATACKETTLRFKVGRGNKQWIEVTLDPSDTYTVELVKLAKGKRFTAEVAERVEDVYCDGLDEVVYHMVNK